MNFETLIELEATRGRHQQVPAAGSAEEAVALARFADFHAILEPERVRRLFPSAFHEDVYFNDTLKAMRGGDRLLELSGGKRGGHR